MEWFYKGLMGVLLLLYLVIITRYLKKYRQHEKNSEVSTPLKQAALLLLVVTLLGFAIPQLLYIFTQTINFADMGVSVVVRFTGLFVYQLGIALFFISNDSFAGSWWSGPEIGHNPHLAKETVYGYVRHPIYTSVYAVIIGCMLVSGNWLVGFCAVIPFTALCAVRVATEEQVLKNKMGSSYAEYRQATGFFLPKLFKKHKRKMLF